MTAAAFKTSGAAWAETTKTPLNKTLAIVLVQHRPQGRCRRTCRTSAAQNGPCWRSVKQSLWTSQSPTASARVRGPRSSRPIESPPTPAALSSFRRRFSCCRVSSRSFCTCHSHVRTAAAVGRAALGAVSYRWRNGSRAGAVQVLRGMACKCNNLCTLHVHEQLHQATSATGVPACEIGPHGCRTHSANPSATESTFHHLWVDGRLPR